MQINLNNGLLDTGQVNDFVFSDFGIEFSDKYSFLTLTETPRLVEINESSNNSESTQNNSYGTYDIKTAEGNFQLDVNSSYDEVAKTILIKADLTALNEVNIQDFVIRMKFLKSKIKHALINGNEIFHKNSEKYYQFHTNQASLVGINNKQLKITRTKEKICNDSEAHIYVRDLKDYWIVHSRIFPTKDCKILWLRWINRFFSLSFSRPISESIRKFPFIFNFLWYRKERMGKGWIHAQIIGFFTLLKNDKISQTIKIEFE